MVVHLEVICSIVLGKATKKWMKTELCQSLRMIRKIVGEKRWCLEWEEELTLLFGRKGAVICVLLQRFRTKVAWT